MKKSPGRPRLLSYLLLFIGLILVIYLAASSLPQYPERRLQRRRLLAPLQNPEIQETLPVYPPPGWTRPGKSTPNRPTRLRRKAISSSPLPPPTPPNRCLSSPPLGAPPKPLPHLYSLPFFHPAPRTNRHARAAAPSSQRRFRQPPLPGRRKLREHSRLFLSHGCSRVDRESSDEDIR